MEPFALLKMMGIFVTGGITGRIVLYLLLLAAGVGVRCALQRRRDFRTAAGISAGLWLVCETSARCMRCRSACSAQPPHWARWASRSRSAWGLPRLSAGCCAGSSLCDSKPNAPRPEPDDTKKHTPERKTLRRAFFCRASAQTLHERVPQLQQPEAHDIAAVGLRDEAHIVV